MSNTYTGKIAVVTGGTSGIGLELARQMAVVGATVVIGGKNKVVGESLSGPVGQGSIDYQPLDVRNAQSVETFVGAVVSKHGRIDYLFHCAGIIMGGEFRDNSIADVENLLTTNVHGTAYVDYYVYRVMVQQGQGHIVNISSAAGLLPTPIMGVYSMSKFGVFALSEMLRMEGKALGVKVSVVTPGFVDTPIYDKAVYSKTNKDKTLDLMRNKSHMQKPERTARIILKGVARNKAVINTWFAMHVFWWMYRWTPGIYKFFAAHFLGPFRQSLRTENSGK